MAVHNMPQLIDIMKDVDTVIFRYIQTTSSVPQVKIVSNVLIRHYIYIKKTVHDKNLACYIHKQVFSKDISLRNHFGGKKHLDPHSNIYQCYKAFADQIKVYNLSQEDEEYLQNSQTENQSYKRADIVSLRNLLPVISLLDFDILEQNCKTNLSYVLKYLCKKTNISEEKDQQEILENFNQYKV